MKTLYYNLLLILSLTLAGCSGSNNNTDKEQYKNETQQEETIKIEGTIEGAAGQELKIKKAISTTEAQPIDSLVIGESGKFSFEVPVKNIDFFTLELEQKMPISLFVEKDDQPVITSSYENFPEFTVKGAQHAEYINDYLNAMTQFQKDRYAMLQRSKNLPFEAKDQRKAVLDSIKLASDELKRLAQTTINKAPSSPAMIIPLMNFFPKTSLQSYDSTNLETIKTVRDAMGKEYSNTLFYNQLNKDYQMVVKQLQKMNRPKDEAPEINLPNPQGENIALSSLRGKVVLVDFWASWCGPCRRENPNVVRLYKKYKDQGFTVYSVSLDGVPKQKQMGNSKQSWEQAIQQDGLIWPNHVSELEGWNSQVIKDYGINSIPYTLLLDREGKIIGERLRGPGLEQKLEEIFSK